MRFAELSLERYGRFEDCTLDFRSGAPDLHVIYGANEAGKSTTLSAVADLLFGFPARSPYNFRFDYPLLRVGAVLEEGADRFACRRRKAQSQSLVNADDKPIDPGPLLAMLRGQDRERFRLGFSLDQSRLREGGQAMVQARDDLGQALFAAGSGMTGVTAALSALETEADAIWGRRASAKRLYTVAERRHEEACHQLRDLQLRPKAWNDARAAFERNAEALAGLEGERVKRDGERRRVERLRRIGPDVRRRAELLALPGTELPAILPAHAEASALAALADLALAERAGSAATNLLEDLDTQAGALVVDEAVLRAREEIAALIERRGERRKAALDLIRLEIELRGERDRETRLRAEVGAAAPAVSRLVVARLRELAGRHAQLNARLSELRGSVDDLDQKVAPLQRKLADAPVAENLPELVAAVEAARALGDDVDARCLGQAREAERLEEEALAAIARLAPWTGSADALAALPEVAEEEIDAAEAAFARLGNEGEAERAAMARAEEELAALAVERRGLAESGQAVPAERIAQVRAARDARWNGLRGLLLGGATPADPTAEAEAFQGAVVVADQTADQRFALAETSGRLAALDARIAGLNLAREQAEARAARANQASATAEGAWAARLSGAGLPMLAPLRLRAWRKARREAIDATRGARQAREALAADLARREAARTRLLTCLTPGPAAEASGGALAPALERAGRLRAEGEARNQQFVDAKREARGLEQQLTDLSRRVARGDSEQAEAHAEWERERSAAGLDLAIAGAEARLAILDELRTVSEAADALAARIAGMIRDADAFAVDVAALASELGQAAETDPGATLDGLVARLDEARSAADGRAVVEANRRGRADDLKTAQAAAAAALAALAAVMEQLGTLEVALVPEALETGRLERLRREELVAVERRIREAGDGHPLADLVAACEAEDAEALAVRGQVLDQELAALDSRITDAADATGVARRTFEALESGPGAAEAAADVALARAEMDAQAEAYLLKRSQAVVLRWAIERYREQRQNPLLARASELFRTLTLGRYRALKVDLDAASPRLLGLCEDGASLVEVEHMSEGTTDQLFLALRLAAVEQAIAAGMRLPFLADDLFVNFDDDRARAGLQVLATLARSTQVLVFTHHAHLAALAREVVGAEVLSECQLV